MATKFSKRVTKGTNYRVDIDILTSSNRTSKISKAMNDIISTANKRIKRLNKSGIISTALETQRIASGNDNFKFSLKGKNFEQQKAVYTQAIQFLQNPTSQAGGAKEYAQSIYKENESKIVEILNKRLQDKLNPKGLELKGIENNDVKNIVNEIIRNATEMSIFNNDFSYKSPIIRDLVESNIDSELSNLEVDIDNSIADKDFFDFMDSQIQ